MASLFGVVIWGDIGTSSYVFAQVLFKIVHVLTSCLSQILHGSICLLLYCVCIFANANHLGIPMDTPGTFTKLFVDIITNNSIILQHSRKKLLLLKKLDLITTRRDCGGWETE